MDGTDKTTTNTGTTNTDQRVSWYAPLKYPAQMLAAAAAIGTVLALIIARQDHVDTLVGAIRAGSELPAADFSLFAQILFVACLVFLTAAMLLTDTFRVGFLAASIVSGSLLIITAAAYMRAWGFLFSMLPAVVVIRHAVYERMIRRNEFERAKAARQGRGERALSTAAIDGHLKNYEVGLLTLRFGLPAFFILIVGSLVHAALWGASGEELFEDRDALTWVAAARLGAVGAYLYVLTSLGQRAFRRDVTHGLAQWSAVMFVLGPLTAAVASLAITPISGDGDGGKLSVTNQALFFVAGLSPRLVAGLLEETVRRILTTKGNDTDGSTIPLTKLRGVNRIIAERLEEEGIFDVFTLAHADPFRLIRNTSYDVRQIVSWMDEALLIKNVPQLWEKLEVNGITSAIDLAYRYELDDVKWRETAEGVGRIGAEIGLSRDDIEGLQRLVSVDRAKFRARLEGLPVEKRDLFAQRLQAPGAHTVKLAETLGIPAEALFEIIYILYHDNHIALIWALYNMSDTELDGESIESRGGSAGSVGAGESSTR